jgi:hypothetical protein
VANVRQRNGGKRHDTLTSNARHVPDRALHNADVVGLFARPCLCPARDSSFLFLVIMLEYHMPILSRLACATDHLCGKIQKKVLIQFSDPGD